MYCFTRSEYIFQEYVDKIQAGSVMRNDCLVHFGNAHLPCGGLGSSGFGTYHGKYSFDTFSHHMAKQYRPCTPGLDWGMLRYHPYGALKEAVLPIVMNLPDIPVLYWKFWTVLIVVLMVAWKKEVLAEMSWVGAFLVGGRFE